MSVETDIASAALRRELAIELRSAFMKARDGSPRHAALDLLLSRENARLRNAGPEEAAQIARSAIAEIERIAADDLADRERARLANRKLVDDARLWEQKRQYQIAWAQRVSAGTSAAINLLERRLVAAHQRLGAVSTEAELRDALGDIADGLKSMQATIAVEGRASVDREATVAKAAA